MRVILLIMIGLSYIGASEVFEESRTGLVWQDNNDAKNNKMKWQDAVEYCQSLELNGRSDWYLPTIKELQSIVDISRYNPAIKKGFKNVNTSDYYWSSSVYVSYTKYAWIVYFEDGYAYNFHKTNEYYVRCVRGRQ